MMCLNCLLGKAGRLLGIYTVMEEELIIWPWEEL